MTFHKLTKMNLKRLSFFVFAAFLLFTVSCDVYKQVAEMKTLGKCEFRLQSVEDIALAGVNVSNQKSLADLSLGDAAKLAMAAGSPQFPLNLTMNIEVRNPNSTAAGLSKIDWILLIDDIEMCNGILNKTVTIPANNGIASIPLTVQSDLKKVLTGKNAETLINFGMNLSGNGTEPTRFTLKLKPTIMISGFPIVYPGYINVKTDFTSL